ncbi:MAG: efflux RND transporter permease subunit [Treponema sp.]|nr:efflux RND transporter permease subunit [Treponema sp.]
MSMVKTVVSRPVTIFIIFLLLIGLGIFAMTNLPIDLYPEINLPMLAIYTSYSGAGPEEVERSVTRLLEATLSSVSGMENVTSMSSKGTSLVIMEFGYGTDIAEAANSIRDSLDRIRNYLPSGSQSPIIFKADPSMLPIMTLMITSDRRTSEELREIAEDTIVPRIEQTPGISTASVNGGRSKIIRVEIPQSRLEAYELTITQIQQMLAVQNMQTAAGTITEGGMSYILTTMGEYTSIEEIKNTAVTYRGGGYTGTSVEMPRQVFLRDIADVYEGYKDESSIVYVNGQAAVTLSVQKQSGKNSVQTANELRKRVDRISRELPSDIAVTELYNNTDIVENSLNQVTSTAFMGAFLAVFTLFIFLRSLKPTIIIGLSIPVSVIITMLLMYFWGLTLNLMTMAGLVLGIGMLIDNSIVILENIYQYREKGAKLKTASILGTSEMIVAITASTLTTICVFAPMVMFQGLLEMAGELFAGLAFTVVISLGISLFTAIFLVPVLCSHFLPIVTRKQKPLKGVLAKIDTGFAKFFTWLDNSYMHAVKKVLNLKFITITSLVILLALSGFMIPVIGWELMPQQESDNVSITATLPMGTPLVETEAILRQLQLIVEREIKGYKDITIQAGGGSIMNFGAGNTNSGSLRISLPEYSQRIETANEIQDILEPYLKQIPGVEFSFGGGLDLSMLGGSNVEIKLRTDNLVKGKEIGERIANLLNERLSRYIIEPAVDLQDGLPQYEIIIDREKMYALGLNTYTVGNEIRAAVDGVTATRYKTGGKDYDVILVLSEADRSTLPALDKIFVNSQLAGRVSLSSFVHYQQGVGPMTINRENQSRVITVSASVRTGVSTNHLQTFVENLIKTEIPIEDDVLIEYGGANAQMERIFSRFILIVIVAIILVFGIMASLFESFRSPFIIILTIPLSVIGIVAIYMITGTIFNMLTAVGLLVLVGIITNNGIILVDYTNLLRKRGYALNDAIIAAARSRLRPILMTTVTTVLGLMPMAFFPGEGAELVAPIGLTVLGGLSFGTLMTLFLMPVMYAIINKDSDKRAAIAQEKRERIAAGEGRSKAKTQVKPAKARDTEGA